MGDIDIDLFLEKLRHLITNSKLDLVEHKKEQLQSLEKNIKYLRESLKVIETKSNKVLDLMELMRWIRHTIFNIEIIVARFEARELKNQRAQAFDYERHQEAMKNRRLARALDNVRALKNLGHYERAQEALKNQRALVLDCVKALKNQRANQKAQEELKNQRFRAFQYVRALKNLRAQALDYKRARKALKNLRARALHFERAEEALKNQRARAFDYESYVRAGKALKKLRARALIVYKRAQEALKNQRARALNYVRALKKLRARAMDYKRAQEALKNQRAQEALRNQRAQEALKNQRARALDYVTALKNQRARALDYERAQEALKNQRARALNYVRALKNLRARALDYKRARKALKNQRGQALMNMLARVLKKGAQPLDYERAQALKNQRHRIKYVNNHLCLNLETVKKKVETLLDMVKLIDNENMYEINGEATLKHSSSGSGGSGLSGRRNTSDEGQKKLVVGFEKGINELLDQLCNSCKGLKIISIIGAAGGGKTTVAKEIYDRPLMMHSFDIRAWLILSQDYDKTTMKRGLLLSILKNASQGSPKDYEKCSDDALAEKVLKCLKGKKYLIVIDDIWRLEDWYDIQRSFPRECDGSAVLLTSREPVLDDSICRIHRLPLLDENSSWDLLQTQVFGTEGCKQEELVNIGKEITKKCGGLALAIVTIAGILKTQDKTLNVWESVCQDLHSIFVQSPNDWMKILELSYNHLPLHLKACFLYIGGYPEDAEIPVHELTWLWIAEGFIQQNEGGGSLEEAIAKNYLVYLINRSLVMVATKSFIGGIKACRIHDLLRLFCLKKVYEENFLVSIYDKDSFPGESPRRLFVDSGFFWSYKRRGPYPRYLGSFMCFSRNKNDLEYQKHALDFAKDCELLRIFNYTSSSSYMYHPHALDEYQIDHLVHLRYVAFKSGYHWFHKTRFSSLLNLETLILNYRAPVKIDLSWDILKMIKLRHLYAKRPRFQWHDSQPPADCCSLMLDSLQTLKPMCGCAICQKFLIRTPNLKKLGVEGSYGDLISEDGTWMLPNLEFLECLETLRLAFFKDNLSEDGQIITLRAGLKLPLTIKQLTLEYTNLCWDNLSILLTALPNLEVLKLLAGAGRGPVWDTSEVEWFSKIKYLRLDDLYIEEWIAGEDQLGRLEVLVIRNCRYLIQIPNIFCELNDLREIEVTSSTRSAEKSAKDIQNEQRVNRGDDDCMNLLLRNNQYQNHDPSENEDISSDHDPSENEDIPSDHDPSEYPDPSENEDIPSD